MLSQSELNRIWKDIIEGKFNGDINPERIPTTGADIMSIPIAGGTAREVYERLHKDGEEWKQCPYVGQDK